LETLEWWILAPSLLPHTATLAWSLIFRIFQKMYRTALFRSFPIFPRRFPDRTLPSTSIFHFSFPPKRPVLTSLGNVDFSHKVPLFLFSWIFWFSLFHPPQIS
jgi:hypothetical protein